MKPLLLTDNPKYLKRLVRELNGNIEGFYASIGAYNVRCNRARLTKGVLMCRSKACSPMWFVPAKQRFIDPHSREIVASRKG